MAGKDQRKADPTAADSRENPEGPRGDDVRSDAEVGRETDELLQVAESLSRASQSFARQEEVYADVRALQVDLKRALSEVIASIERQAVAPPPPVVRAEPAPTAPVEITRSTNVVGSGSDTSPGGGGCDCDCVSASCCCFDVVLDRIRAIRPQGEPADSGGLGPLANDLEVVVFASIDGTGLLWPSLWGTVPLAVGSIVLGGKPGPWLPINGVIKRVCLKKGTSMDVQVDFQVVESDAHIERPIGFRDEFGTASATITLNCCMPRVYPTMPVDVVLDQGGLSGGVDAIVSLAFSARRVCC